MRRPSAWASLVLALAGCFADEATETPTDCPVGSRGCPCTAGDGCDDGLTCHGPSGLCFDPECERGTETCECLEGECVGMLECRDMLCQAATPQSTDATSNGESSTNATTSSSDSGGSSTMADVSTSDVSQGTSSSTDATTSGAPNLCGECIDSTGMKGCITDYNACLTEDDGGCEAALECAQAIGASGLCCPPMDDGGSVSAWNDLLSCVVDACTKICGTIDSCPGG